MSRPIQMITALIRSGQICNAQTFADQHATLHKRYESTFEEPWLACFNELKRVQLGKDDSVALDELRETAYRTTFSLTADDELAGLVSDDFELIGKAAALQVSLPWLNGLWIEYRNRVFPAGEIVASDELISFSVD